MVLLGLYLLVYYQVESYHTQKFNFIYRWHHVLGDNRLKTSDVSQNLLHSHIPEIPRGLLMSEKDDSNKDDSKEIPGIVDDEIDINKILNESDIPSEIDSFEQSILDESIQHAVKNLLAQPKQPEIEPLEVFNDMMRNIMTKTKKSSEKPDAKAMLEKLFPKDEGKDPFDEKVVIKLYRMMEKEDFDQVFRDPIIGDYL